jgi:hypothetical protein
MEPKDDPNRYRQKSDEYRTKAREASEPRTRAALDAVAREYLRRANEPGSTEDRED